MQKKCPLLLLLLLLYLLELDLLYGDRAGLQGNVPADLLPRWQKVHQFRATRPRRADVPDWVTTSAVQPTFWDSDSFNLKCRGRQLAPKKCNLGRGSVWDVVMQPSPGSGKFIVVQEVNPCQNWANQLGV